MRPQKNTPEIEALLRGEAEQRARRLTNKQIADRTGLSRLYVAQRISRMRREIEIKIVPHETSTS